MIFPRHALAGQGATPCAEAVVFRDLAALALALAGNRFVSGPFSHIENLKFIILNSILAAE